MADTDATGPYARRKSERRSKRRTEAQRDRDRILYSTAFRRLAGVTQVESPQTGQILHNRLTHTLKVAQVARRLAERFNDEADDTLIDPDVVETASLAHDLGHPPFGHIGEVELERLSQRVGGFEGNAQSFRVATRLGRRSMDYDGLNLTRASLNGMLKYPWRREDHGDRSQKWGVYEDDQSVFEWARKELDPDLADKQTLEAQIMDWSDDVTYASHDVEDFFRAGLVPLERLHSQEEERVRFLSSFLGEDFRSPIARVAKTGSAEELERIAHSLFADLIIFKRPYSGDRESRVRVREITSGVIGLLFEGCELRDDGRLGVGATARAQVAVLKELTWFYVIDRPSLALQQEGQRRALRFLGEILRDAAKDPKRHRLFPVGVAELLRDVTAIEPERGRQIERIVIDYIAGMSEAEAMKAFQLLSQGGEQHRLLPGFEA